MRLKKLFVAGLAALAVVLTACGSDDDGDADASASESSASTEEGAGDPSMPEPDLEGIPDVVAEVNGEEIGKDEFVPAYERQFQQMAAQAQMTGEEPDEDQMKQQVADSLVNTELLDQAAQDRGFEATDEEVDQTLTELAESNQMGSSKEFLAALEEQGMSEDEVMSQVSVQVKVDQLLEDEAGNVKPTEAELRKAYDAMKAQGQQTGQETPGFKKVRPQLVEQVKSEKLNSTAETLIEDLRKDAEITVHL